LSPLPPDAMPLDVAQQSVASPPASDSEESGDGNESDDETDSDYQAQQESESDDEEDEEMPARSSRRQTYQSGRSSTQGAGGKGGRASKGRGGKNVVDDEEDEAEIEVEDITFSDDEEDRVGSKTQLYQALTQGGKRGKGGADGDDEDDPEEMDAMEEARLKMQRWKDTMDLNHPIDEGTANKVMTELIKGLKHCRQNGQETIEYLSECASALEEHNDQKEEHPVGSWECMRSDRSQLIGPFS